MHPATNLPGHRTVDAIDPTPTIPETDEKSQTQRLDFANTNNKSPSLQAKDDAETLENVELGPRATYINTGAAAGLPQEHRDYLLARHGTLELDPIPDMGDQDPYNWPQWKVCILLAHFSPSLPIIFPQNSHQTGTKYSHKSRKSPTSSS